MPPGPGLKERGQDPAEPRLSKRSSFAFGRDYFCLNDRGRRPAEDQAGGRVVKSRKIPQKTGVKREFMGRQVEKRGSTLSVTRERPMTPRGN